MVGMGIRSHYFSACETQDFSSYIYTTLPNIFCDNNISCGVEKVGEL